MIPISTAKQGIQTYIKQEKMKEDIHKTNGKVSRNKIQINRK
jgi:hypothetical protein